MRFHGLGHMLAHKPAESRLSPEAHSPAHSPAGLHHAVMEVDVHLDTSACRAQYSDKMKLHEEAVPPHRLP